MVPGNDSGPDWAWPSSGSSWESVGGLPISAEGFSAVGLVLVTGEESDADSYVDFYAEGLVLETGEESDADSCHFSLA